MTTNVNGRNRDYEALVRLVAEKRPDHRRRAGGVVGLAADLVHAGGTAALRRSAISGTTVVVASRYPIEASRVPLTLAGMPDGLTGGAAPLRVEIHRPGGTRPLVLYAIHAPTTRTWRGWTVRQHYLRRIRQSVLRDDAAADVIVAGDWNTPFWSPRLASFLGTDGRLRTTERGASAAADALLPRIRPAAGTRHADRPRRRLGPHRLRRCRGRPRYRPDHLPATADLAIP